MKEKEPNTNILAKGKSKTIYGRVLVGVICLLLWTASQSNEIRIPEYLREFLLTLSVVLLVTVVDRLFFVQEFRSEFGDLLGERIKARDEIISLSAPATAQVVQAVRDGVSAAVSTPVFQSSVVPAIQASLREHSAFLTSLEAAGITAVWQERTMAMSAIRESVSHAKCRIHVIGLGMANGMNMQEFVRDIGTVDVASNKTDIKICVMNPYSDAAVLRNLLEAAPEDRRIILGGDSRVDFHALERFANLPLHRAFRACFGALQLSEGAKLRKHVRFSKIDVGLWAMVIDDTCYFQPYAFIKSNVRLYRSLSDALPVLRIEKGADSRAFASICDHIQTIWEASARFDWAKMTALDTAREKLLQQRIERIKRTYRPLFAEVGISKFAGVERRIDGEHHPCEHSPPIEVQCTVNGQVFGALLTDYSLGGCGFVAKCDFAYDDAGPHPRISVVSPKGLPEDASRLIESFFDHSRRIGTIRWKGKGEQSRKFGVQFVTES